MRSRLALLAIALIALLLVPAAPAKGPKPKDNDTHVQLLAINDFHGNLLPPSGSSGRVQTGCCLPDSNGNLVVPKTTDVGGIEYLATHVKELRDLNSNTITVGAGDQIGASPLISGLFHDEPSILGLNSLGLDVTAVGNHEFDEGINELLRMQYGGCTSDPTTCVGGYFPGSIFQYLAANVFYAHTDRTVLPPYEVRKIDNTKLAFIGLTLEGTPNIVTPAGVAGLEFHNEVATVNALVEQLRNEQGVKAFVVLIHQGGQQNGPFKDGYMNVNACENFSGDIGPIVDQLDSRVSVVVSAHTHQPYICDRNGKLLTSAASFGRLITKIDLTIDHQSKTVTSADAQNVLVTRDVPKDAAETAIVSKYDALSGPIAHRVIGSITADITRTPSSAGESALGDVIADAQLDSTQPSDFGGAVVAFMNPGGIRADLTYANKDGSENPGEITYNELFTVQPFNNVMNVKTMTGAQIYALLEQQFDNPSTGANRFLQISHGFGYAYSASAAHGAHIVPGSVTVEGAPVVATASYQVAMNNFLASGGDGFTVFRDGTNQLGGEIDIDAAVNYFLKHSPVAPGPQDRITRLP